MIDDGGWRDGYVPRRLFSGGRRLHTFATQIAHLTAHVQLHPSHRPLSLEADFAWIRGTTKAKRHQGCPEGTERRPDERVSRPRGSDSELEGIQQTPCPLASVVSLPGASRGARHLDPVDAQVE